MAQLIKLPKELIHQRNNIGALLFNYFIEVTDITEEDGNFILFLLEGELIAFKMIFDKFRN